MSIFTDWLVNLDAKMRNSDRRILMLLDNASCHKEPQGLTNITLHFLPPRTTSALQPCDAGIIRSFKAQYRRMFIQNRVDAYDDSLDNNAVLKPFTIKDAIYMVADAWNCVKTSTIVNCWKKTGILPDYDMEEATLQVETEAQNDCNRLENLLSRLPYTDRETAEGTHYSYLFN